MKRYYFVSDDLSDLATVEKELQQQGVSPLQMHLVSNSEAEAQQLGLHQVSSLFKNDIIYSMLTGFAIGAIVSAMLIFIGLMVGLQGEAWAIMSIVCLFILGFCTWEGGLFGIQVPNRHYRRFSRALKQGRHLFFVDVAHEQKSILDEAAERHAHLKPVGDGDGEWNWLFSLRSAAHRLTRDS